MTENGTGKSLKKIVHSIHHTNKEEGGSGLSRAIVEKHNGSINVASAESGYLGMRASIFLPLKPQARMNADETADGSASYSQI